jgi:hypothetical protein
MDAAWPDCIQGMCSGTLVSVARVRPPMSPGHVTEEAGEGAGVYGDSTPNMRRAASPATIMVRTWAGDVK